MFFEPDYNNDYNKSWPSSGDGYLLRDGTRVRYRLSNCTPGASVCYGAEEDARKDGHWGAYLDGCDEIGDWSCCKTCPASGVQEAATTNLICPGGGSGDVGNGSDGFRSRVRLSDASGRAVGSNVRASKESGEPKHAGKRGGHSVWWTWTAPASGTFIFDTRGSDFDTLLAVYTGNSVSRLNRIASNDDIDRRARIYQSEVRFKAQQGQTYHIAVDGYGGATGNIVLHWKAEEKPDDANEDALDDVNVTIPASCSRQVQLCVRDHQCEDGDEISVSVNGSSVFSGELFNAPQCFDVPVRQGTNSVRLLALNGTGYKGNCGHQDENTGEIRINDTSQQWSHSGGTGSTANLNVTIGPPGGTCSPTSGLGGCSGGNDDFRCRTRLDGASGQANGDNEGAGKESGEPEHDDKSGGASVWWTWTAPASGTFIFDTRGSDFDTLLAVYTGNSVNRLTGVASDDDIGGGVRQSEVSVTAQQGQTYHIAVDGYGDATGNIVLNWRTSSGGSNPDEDPLDDFNVTIPSSCSQQVEICVRDWSCEDGDEVRVSVNGAQVLQTELFNAPRCVSAPVRQGANTISLFAINGSAYKCGGGCSSSCRPGDPTGVPDLNSGEIRINGAATQRWEHAGGAGSTANLNVTIGPPAASCPGSTPGTPPSTTSYGAVAIDLLDDCGYAAGLSWSNSTEQGALNRAISECLVWGGSQADCTTHSDTYHQCAAIAYGESSLYCWIGADVGPSADSARSAALSKCRSKPEGYSCQVVDSACNQ